MENVSQKSVSRLPKNASQFPTCDLVSKNCFFFQINQLHFWETGTHFWEPRRMFRKLGKVWRLGDISGYREIPHNLGKQGHNFRKRHTISGDWQRPFFGISAFKFLTANMLYTIPRKNVFTSPFKEIKLLVTVKSKLIKTDYLVSPRRTKRLKPRRNICQSLKICGNARNHLGFGV